MHRLLHIIAALLMVVVLSTPVDGARPKTTTSASNVKNRRQQTENRIKETNNRLSKNAHELNRKLNGLNFLEAEMRRQVIEINRMRTEVDSLTDATNLLADSVSSLESTLAKMRRNYSIAVRRQRASRNEMSDFAFLFSSESFAQAYRRYRYLQQYSKWRTRKATEITLAMNELNSQRVRLAERRTALATAIDRLNAEQSTLTERRDSTRTIIKSLKKEERSLKKLLTEQQAEARRLDSELEKLIALEQQKAKEQTKQTPQKPSTTPVKPSATDNKKQQKSTETVRLSNDFAENQGKLPWPVRGSRTIVKPFGRHKHPDMPYVEVNNSGIDIQTDNGTKAYAVFPGKVSAIFRQPGFDNVVMVRHGEYITIYANISDLSVKKDDTLALGAEIGTIRSDANDKNRTILHFEIRKEKEKLDPAKWLKP